MPESFERGALTEGVYFIMVALQEPMHGYCVMRRVSEMSNGRVNLCPGTLYGALNTLLQKEWIQSAGSSDDCGRRKDYVLTPEGRQVLACEIARLRELVEIGENYAAESCGEEGEPEK